MYSQIVNDKGQGQGTADENGKNGTNHSTNNSILQFITKITKNIVNPINTIENLLNDPNYSETIRLLFFCLGLLLVVCIFNFILYRKMKKASQEALLDEQYEQYHPYFPVRGARYIPRGAPTLVVLRFQTVGIIL